MSVAQYSIVGLGKLGSSMAAAIASRGFDVVGVDVVPGNVENINRGLAPVQETNLGEMIAQHKHHIRGTLDVTDAVSSSDVTFVTVPTPSDDRGAFSVEYAAHAFRAIGEALRHKDTYHLVVLTSTVLPGATRFGLLPLLEEASGKTCGQDFGLCYSPVYIALGSVIRDFLYPDYSLVGEFDQRSGELLASCYADIVANDAIAQRMSIENAELTKIATNTYVTTKITFANMLADLCERIPGGDIDVVTQALGSDKRIGQRYLKGAIGYGGPCFPRDNIALGFMARALDTRADLAEITDSYNRAMMPKAINQLRGIIPEKSRVAVLGLAYKPASHVTEQSQGLELAQLLADEGHQVIAYDPMIGQLTEGDRRQNLTTADSVKSCIKDADAVLITTPEKVFKGLKATDLHKKGQRVVVVDFWRQLQETLANDDRFEYVGIGLSRDEAGNISAMNRLWGQLQEA